jgi:hypothetical protein
VRDDVVVTSDPRFRKPEPPLHIDAGDGGDWIKLIAAGRSTTSSSSATVTTSSRTRRSTS